MKKRSIGVIAVLAIAGSAVRKFKKFIVGGMFAVVIGAFSMFNVGLNSQNEFSAIYKANVEALSSEIWSDCSGPYTVMSADTNYYVNGFMYKQSTIVDCDEGGSYSCIEGSYYRLRNEDGTWANWTPC
jgi:hypothetical protein